MADQMALEDITNCPIHNIDEDNNLFSHPSTQNRPSRTEHRLRMLAKNFKDIRASSMASSSSSAMRPFGTARLTPGRTTGRMQLQQQQTQQQQQINAPEPMIAIALSDMEYLMRSARSSRSSGRLPSTLVTGCYKRGEDQGRGHSVRLGRCWDDMPATIHNIYYNDDELSRSSIAARTIWECAFIEDGKKQTCFDDQHKARMKYCTEQWKLSQETCKQRVDNGFAIMCKQVINFTPCDTFKGQLILPTTTTTTTLAPPTTAAPFPVAHTIGGAAGGFLVAIILSVIFMWCKKKKNVKKAPYNGTTTGTFTQTGTTTTGTTATGTRTTGKRGKTRGTGYV